MAQLKKVMLIVSEISVNYGQLFNKFFTLSELTI
jgi:hypothetical protein